MKKKLTALHLKDAVRLLKNGAPHDLKLWKISSGEILRYDGVKYHSSYERGGIVRVIFPNGELRAFREISLFSIDDLNIYL